MTAASRVRTSRLVLVAMAATGLVLTAPAVAHAAPGLSPAPSVDGNGDEYYADATTVTVTKTGLSASTDYYVGQCATASYLFGIPACSSMDTVTTDSSGSLTAVLDVASDGANVHDGVMPDQPATVDCSAVDSCEIVVVDHSTRVTVDSSAEFYVS